MVIHKGVKGQVEIHIKGDKNSGWLDVSEAHSGDGGPTAKRW